MSHDLRTPLRAIVAYCNLLVDEHGPSLNAEGRELLQRMELAAKRQATLIDDLLQFARIGRQALRREEVDLSEVARRVLEDFRGQYPHLDWRIEPSGIAYADPGLIRMALDNLLGNAAKYSSHTEHPIVEFFEKDGAYVVRDNGAGFEQEYADRMFQPFQRLHSEGEFPGTGIGLANVRRIIERHGGHVWAEGTPGVGASFFFTLP